MRMVGIWTLMTGLGALLIALPDSDQAVVRFSAEHGPGPLDTIGAILLIGAFLLLLTVILRARRGLVTAVAARPAILGGLGFAAGLGLGMLLAGVFTDFWWWWLIGAGVMQLFWLSLFGMALRMR